MNNPAPDLFAFADRPPAPVPAGQSAPDTRAGILKFCQQPGAYGFLHGAVVQRLRFRSAGGFPEAGPKGEADSVSDWDELVEAGHLVRTKNIYKMR